MAGVVFSGPEPRERMMVPIVRRPLAALVLAVVAAGGISVGTARGGDQPIAAVIELFTSQGCSSCPPADALFAQYVTRPGVLALSFNVDYWDYLGWKDTLASPDNTARQRDYAAARGDGQVYTPQVIVDGRTHLVGSDRDGIDTAVAASAGLLPVPISLTPSPEALTVSVGEAPTTGMRHATLWLVMYEPSVTVPVERGENSGRTLTYSNVVRKLRPVAWWKGKQMAVDVPQSELAHARTSGCAFLLQTEKANGLPGPILGAAAIDINK
jgi:hypothetical protein